MMNETSQKQNIGGGFSIKNSLISNLSASSKKILSILLNQDEVMSSDEIGDQLGISARSVQYYINKEIELFLREFDFNLVKKPNYGIFINNSSEDKRKLFVELSGSILKSFPIPNDERRDLFILILVFSEIPINMDELTSIFNLSRGTLFNDLKFIKGDLLRKGLNLNWKRNSGYVIEGNEVTIREYILDLLMKKYSLNFLYQLFKEKNYHDTYRKLNENDLTYIPNYLMKYHLRYYWDLLYYSTIDHDFNMDDVSKITLALYLVLIIHRNLRGYSIQQDIENNYSFISEEIEIADNIIRKLETKHKISLVQSEKNYLVLKLSLSNQNRFDEYLNRDSTSQLSLIHNITTDIINCSSQYLHPWLINDQDLFIGLYSHLEIIVERLKHDLNANNPYLPEIKSKYQYIFKIVKTCIKLIEHKTGLVFSEDEIGNLTMHFAAAMERIHLVSKKNIDACIVCMEESSALILLLSRLRSEFPNITIKSVHNISEVSKEKINSRMYDVVLSTMLINFLDVPVILISPFITQNDKEKIKHLISKINKDDGREYPEDIDLTKIPSIKNIISKELILLNGEADSWEEAVRKTSRILEKMGYINNQYTKEIVGALMKNGPYMVSWPNVALLHAKPCDGVRQLSIGMAVFKDPIVFGNKSNDPVKIAFVIATTDKITHLRILFELNKICTNHTLVQKLISAKTKDEVLLLIRNQCQIYESSEYQEWLNYSQ